MAGVYFCSPLNSTFFTNCCHVAICDDQINCPKCSKPVYPHEHRNDTFTSNQRHMMRWSNAKANSPGCCG